MEQKIIAPVVQAYCSELLGNKLNNRGKDYANST